MADPTPNTATPPAVKPAEKKSPIREFTGFVGGIFAAYAHDDMEFGAPGPFKIGDREMKVTSWKGSCVKGEVPRDMKPGEHVIEVDGTKTKGRLF